MGFKRALRASASLLLAWAFTTGCTVNAASTPTAMQCRRCRSVATGNSAWVIHCAGAQLTPVQNDSTLNCGDGVSEADGDIGFCCGTYRPAAPVQSITVWAVRMARPAIRVLGQKRPTELRPDTRVWRRCKRRERQFSVLLHQRSCHEQLRTRCERCGLYWRLVRFLVLVDRYANRRQFGAQLQRPRRLATTVPHSIAASGFTQGTSSCSADSSCRRLYRQTRSGSPARLRIRRIKLRPRSLAALPLQVPTASRSIAVRTIDT